MNSQLRTLLSAQVGPVSSVLPSQREDLAADPGLGPALRETNGALEVTTQAAPADRGSVFVAVTGAEAQETSATALVVAAYGLFWLFAFLLVWLTFRGQERIFRRMTVLMQKLPTGVDAP